MVKRYPTVTCFETAAQRIVRYIRDTYNVAAGIDRKRPGLFDVWVDTDIHTAFDIAYDPAWYYFVSGKLFASSSSHDERNQS